MKYQLLGLALLLNATAGLANEEETLNAQYDGPGFRYEIEPMFTVGKEYTVKQHLIMGDGLSMTMERAIVANKTDSSRSETWFQFNVFSKEAALAADQYMSAPLQYISNRLTQESSQKLIGESQYTDEDVQMSEEFEEKSSGTPLVAILTKAQDHSGIELDDQLYETMMKKLEETEKTFGQNIMNAEEAPSTDKNPLGYGEYFQAGNPISGFGLPQLATLLNRLQADNPQAGALSLRIGFMPKKLQKNGVEIGLIKFQLCQLSPTDNVEYMCTKTKAMQVRNDSVVLFSSQHEDALTEMLGSKDKNVFQKVFSYLSSSNDPIESFTAKDVFAEIAQHVQTLAGADDYVIRDEDAEEVIVNTYKISPHSESSAEPSKASRIQIDFQQVVRVGEHVPPPIIMEVVRKSKALLETSFSAPPYEQSFRATPAEDLNRVCLDIGMVPFSAYGKRTENCVVKLSNYAYKINEQEKEIQGLKKKADALKEEHEASIEKIRAEQEKAVKEEVSVALKKYIARTAFDELKKPAGALSCRDASYDLDKEIYSIDCNSNLHGVNDGKFYSYEFNYHQCDLEKGSLKLHKDQNTGIPGLTCTHFKTEDTVMGEL